MPFIHGLSINHARVAQAGARKVYAVEASGMAAYAAKLARGNGAVGARLHVLHAKVEEAEVPEKVGVCLCVRVCVCGMG